MQAKATVIQLPGRADSCGWSPASWEGRLVHSLLGRLPRLELLFTTCILNFV
jgi:hypothetical protein